MDHWLEGGEEFSNFFRYFVQNIIIYDLGASVLASHDHIGRILIVMVSWTTSSNHD